MGHYYILGGAGSGAPLHKLEGERAPSTAEKRESA